MGYVDRRFLIGHGYSAQAPRVVWHVGGPQAGYAIHQAELDARGCVVGYALAPLSPLFASAAELRAYLEWLLITGLDCMVQGDAGYLVGSAGIRSWLAAMDMPCIEVERGSGG